MEFNPEGGIFLLDLPSVGEELGVTVPWQVAVDGLDLPAGQTPDEAALQDWLQANESRFQHMVAARYAPEAHPAEEPDDPRVLAVEALRHI